MTTTSLETRLSRLETRHPATDAEVETAAARFSRRVELEVLIDLHRLGPAPDTDPEIQKMQAELDRYSKKQRTIDETLLKRAGWFNRLPRTLLSFQIDLMKDLQPLSRAGCDKGS